MEKETYIAPQIEVIELDVVTMLAASNEFGVTETPTDKNADLSNGRRGTWGNLWADNEKE
jgi:hypothetical protein